ncbi:aldose 1-epimerase family protein [Paenibacillus qinlingensis]|uniref:DUF4432 family protein n=1 Tax=Paenibacillus qinlingensis TaxID=1837343 RepID=A0ABU1NXM3_9BACL|nr:aldose 1-epimerase family protein [Paenibacillus qinlingensis]MDR6552236.1 hypothetical protein [Paenibacillus qinlingensis]
MRLYGEKWTRRELEARVGRIEQVGGIRRFQLSEGTEAGTEQIQVRTGAGLCYYVSASRGLDISLAEYAGVPLSWQSPNGDVHPAYFDARGVEWLRTAAGGLLMTCGLTQVGSPCEDEGEACGQHGRIHHLPARQVSAEGNWHGDDYEMRIRGVVEESSIFGHQLCLTREICSRLGDNRIVIRDRVENRGFKPSPHMMLYHFNFGFPLMDEHTTISFPNGQVRARESELPLEGYDTFQEPGVNYRERVYYHTPDMAGRQDGKASVVIRNPNFPLNAGNPGIEVALTWSADTLPRLVQWKMPGAGTYVLGIEPANCWVEGRAAERERGSLVTLEPGESVRYELALEIRGI